MNPDNLPNDELLQFVFGELDEARRPALQKALADDAQLAATAQRLAAAVAAVRAENAGQVSDAFNERLRRRLSEVSEPEQPETTRRASRTRSQSTWRWIMRSRVSRVAAAAIFVVALGAAALWFYGGGSTPALANFLQPLLDAKTVKYTMTVENMGPSVGMAAMMGLSAEAQKDLKNQTEVVMLPDDTRSRTETTSSGKLTRVQIWDARQGTTLYLDPADKRATLYHAAQMPKPNTPKGKDRPSASPRRGAGEPWPVSFFRSLLRDARGKPGLKSEPLGPRDIDGRHVVGFRISDPDEVMSVWGDPQTGLPVRIESSSSLMPNMKLTMSDFVFNLPMDESLFSVKPPTGYKVTEIQEPKPDDSPKTEKDLIELFRFYSDFCGGRFPDLLDMEWVNETVSLREWCLANLGVVDTSMTKRQQEGAQSQRTLQRGLQFTALLPKQADWHYAGRCVWRGAAGTPIFWYRPKNATKYRVIYADLAVREVDTPPRVPVVTVAQLENDLLEMFRQYSQLSGGPLPESLDVPQLMMNLFLEWTLSCSHAQLHPSDAKQEQEREQEASAAEIKLQRGLMFISLLPKDADWHYVGSGVSLGAAGRPIFWYRAQDSKQYRVVYGDLSVHDAGTPPRVPVVPPEQALINALRYYSEESGGPFPSVLDLGLLGTEMFIVKKVPVPIGQKPTAQQTRLLSQAMMKMLPGVTFRDSLPPDADAHYAGKGVSRGAADTPIFWYRPKGGQKYRVLYGDLSLRDAGKPPRAPDPLQDLIDTLRCYSQLSGGTLPDSLDAGMLSALVEKKSGLKKGEEPNAPQLQEMMEIQLKLQPGTMFIAALPAKADAHYAGKGVSLGAARKPIFWYRPKDATKYRVLYGDLSVRDADTPPNVPHAQPLPAPSDRNKQPVPAPSRPKK